mgnify:CR=1 FL=1
MALPEIILPKWMAKIGTKLPGKPPRFVLVSVLNTMLKKGLLPADMELFAGRKFEIEVLDAGIKVRFSANTEKFLDDNFSGTPDLRLAANGIDFMRMMMREEDPDTLFFNRKLQINYQKLTRQCRVAFQRMVPETQYIHFGLINFG